jgi:hypothetical protein
MLFHFEQIDIKARMPFTKSKDLIHLQSQNGSNIRVLLIIYMMEWDCDWKEFAKENLRIWQD